MTFHKTLHIRAGSLARGTSGSVVAVATFALIHGGGGSAWDWHLVAPALREHGHDAVAVDLPGEGESAGWEEYADAVVEAIGDRRGVVVVTTTSLRSLRPRRGGENGTRVRRRCRSRGRSRPGRTRRRGTCSAATTACSRRRGRDATPGSA